MGLPCDWKGASVHHSDGCSDAANAERNGCAASKRMVSGFQFIDSVPSLKDEIKGGESQ